MYPQAEILKKCQTHAKIKEISEIQKVKGQIIDIKDDIIIKNNFLLQTHEKVRLITTNGKACEW